MKRGIFIFVLIALTASSFAQQVDPSKIFDVIFRQNFEDDTPGVYNYDEFMEDWNDPGWSDPRREYWDSYGQIMIVEENGNKFIRHDIKEGEASTNDTHGMQWWSSLGNSLNELYFSFRMRLKPGFEPVLSGKFPGVKGGPTPVVDNPPEYDDGFVHMLTWNNWPDLVTYVYHQDQPGQSGDPFPLDYGLPSGKWITVTFRIVMNSVTNDRGNRDGILETYIDRNLVQQITNFRFRNYESIGIEEMLITNFFGGDPTPEWAAARDEYVDFDDFSAFVFKPEVNVPHGLEPSPPDRVLLLPDDVYNDSIWRHSLSAIPISSQTIDLSWKNYFYPVNYTIKRRTDSEPDYQDIATLDYTVNTFRNSGLLPNTTYYYRIIADNSYSDSATVTTLAPSPPLTPTSLVSVQAGAVTVKLQWNDNSNNEIGFELERSDVSPEIFSQIAVLDRNVKVFTNTSLSPDTDYYYRIRAYNEDGKSDYSGVLHVKTLQLQLPAAPSGLNAGNISKNTCVLTWKDNADNESGFQIYELEESTGSYKLNRTVSANVTQFTFSDLIPNTTYNYKVRAYNGDGASAFTNEIKVTTLPLQPPVAPITLIYDTITPSSVLLSWTDRSDNETGFRIYKSLSQTSGYQLIHSTGENEHTYLNENLNRGTAYFYRVRAFNDDGVSSYTNILKIITPNPPRSPTSITLLSASKTSVEFEWTDNADNEEGFCLERSINTPGQFIITDTLPANTKEFSDQKLKSNTRYYYRLRAFNTDGNSDYSDTLLVKTDPLILPAAPSQLKINKLTPFTVLFSWNDNSSDETGFQLQKTDETKTFHNLASLPPDITQFADTALNDSTIYFYRVRAFNADGYSVFSDTLLVLTPENIIPETPDDFEASSVRYNKVVLTWELNSDGLSGLEIERRSDTTGNFILIAKTDIVTSFADTSVYEGQSYIYRIRAFNSFNFSDYSPSINVSVPFLTLPKPPELLPSATIESNAIEIKWSDNSSDETGFIIKRALYPQNDFVELSTVHTNDTLFIDHTVTPNTTYYYIVNAVNENGQSENSNRIRVSSLSLAETARFKEGLIAYYNFSLNSDTIVHDLSGFGNPVNLHISDTSHINWNRNNQMELLDNTVISSIKPALKIVNACKETNEITLDCWIKPSSDALFTNATILSLSQNPDNIGISLMQSDFALTDNTSYRYLLGLSTKSTESNGKPFLETVKEEVKTLHHIAYTRNNLGEEKLFLNGNLVANSIKPLGFDNWKSDFYLYLGNESSLKSPWKGVYYLLAIYNVALNTDQIMQNFNAGPTDNLIAPKNEFDIKLYPNPSKDFINIEIKPLEYSDYGEKVILQLLDLYGFVHFEEVIKDSNQDYSRKLDLENLAEGIYYIRLLSNSFTSMQKIIIY